MATSISRRAERFTREGVLRWALVVLAAASIGFGALAVSRSSVFHAQSVEVSGAEQLSRARVVELAAVSRSTNVLWLDDGAIEARLESHAWIARADASRVLPWTIRIGIVERSPVALAEDAGRRFLVAADGTVLGSPPAGTDLPRIVLPPVGTPEEARPSVSGPARALGAMEPSLRARVRWIAVAIDGTIELRLHGGLRVRYGLPTDVGAKAGTLARVLAWADAEGVGLARVSVVAPASPAVSLSG